VSTLDTTAPLAGPRATSDVLVGTDGTTGRADAPATPPDGRHQEDGYRPRPAGPRAAVVDRHADFDALADVWDDLWARSRSASPFTSHAWTSAWARAYVPDGKLAVVAVWNGDLLVAALALHRTRRGPLTVLAPLGGEISDHTDVLLDPSVPDAGARLVQALLQVPGWRALDLPEVLPGAPAEAWAQDWPGPVRRLVSSVNLHLPAAPAPEALTRVPARTAATLRRKLRKIEQQGVQTTEVAPEEVPSAVVDLIALHAAQWAGRRGNPEHLTERFRDHLTAALPAMIERNQAVFVEFRVDGELVASEVDLLGGDQLAYYLAGISPALRERMDTAVLLVSRALQRARDRGKSEYSFLRGEEDYKLRWRPDEVVATRFLLARPDLLGAVGYFSATAARDRLLAFARRTLRGRAYEVARTLMHGLRQWRART
jgi:CelD/BcsL family acetyltransferase involved in cellulose biosynthesis